MVTTEMKDDSDRVWSAMRGLVSELGEKRHDKHENAVTFVRVYGVIDQFKARPALAGAPISGP